ncbi:MAG: tryptophan synthase subunit beta like protein [Pseudomonadota bacterium]
MYVKRNEAGKIAMVSREATPECSEWVEFDAVELRNFLEQELSDPERSLEASDLELVRVVEDLVELLTGRGVIRFTDLPEAAQRKLSSRKNLRASARQLNLMADDDENIL